MRVPMNVGPPPMRPSSSRNDHDGLSPSAAIGATMPNPSVALWSPKPMMSKRARLTSPAAADWPMAKPSEKLWKPMPSAMKNASRSGSVRRAIRPAVISELDAAPAFPTKFVVVEGRAAEVPDPDGAVSKRILFRKSAEMFARLGIDRERYFEEWISVG